jgi:putative transposase
VFCPKYRRKVLVNGVDERFKELCREICKYHVVFCPKYRRKVLVNGVDERFKELCREICNEYRIDLLEMEVMPDHVHLLLEVDPQFGIHKAVKHIKGRTSRVLREEFPWIKTKLPTLWTNSYFVSTVGGAPPAIVKQYIESQKTSQRK